MRRLRGQGTPYTPPVIAHTPPPAAPPVYKDTTEVEELKQAV